MMNWETWNYTVKNSKGKEIFHGPLRLCSQFYKIGSGLKLNWTIEDRKNYV